MVRSELWYTCCFFFFFNDTATTEIYTLSLHDALPIFSAGGLRCSGYDLNVFGTTPRFRRGGLSKPGGRRKQSAVKCSLHTTV